MKRGKVCQHEFSIDGVIVGFGIDCPFFDNIGVFECPDNVRDDTDLANVAEKFVAKAGTFGRAFDKAGDVDELDGGGLEGR